MKFRIFSAIFLAVFSFCFVSCGGSDEGGESSGGGGSACETTLDCPMGYVCDKTEKICTQNNGNNGGADSGDSCDDCDSGDSGDSGSNGGADTGDSGSSNKGTAQDPCKPGATQECPYQGNPNAIGKGPCKQAVRTCKADGTWGKCEGEVLPVFEIGPLCSDGIDNDCNGVVDDGTDIDGDGYGACEDCCETADECGGYDPATINPAGAEISDNGVDDNCNGQIDEDPSCDGADEPLQLDDYPGNAVKLAHAMGICGDQLVEATLSLAGDPAVEQIKDEQCIYYPYTGGTTVSRQSLPMPYYTSEYQTFAAATKYGNNITPKEGSKIAILATGPWNAPTQEFQCAKLSSGDMKTASKVPADWMNTMPGCTIPRSPSCGGTAVEDGLTNQCAGKELPTVQDPVMLTLKIKVPKNARAFQFNLFFISAEYPGTACASEAFNDFFFALLDSEHNTKYPDDEFQNPYDKNLGKDAKGNFVGIDLAPEGLFTVCKNPSNGQSNNYASFCTKGSTLLEGTTFNEMSAGSGGTDWLTTRGNVVPGETITLRLAIFEQGTVQSYGSDHSYDSIVLLDGFKWLPNPAKAGTSQY